MRRITRVLTQEHGVTLIEMLIVLALIGILLAVVVPNLTGFLGRGNDRAYESDRQNIQAAANAYYTDTRTRPGTRVFPTGNGTAGSAGTNTYVDLTSLVNGKYLRDIPQSASSDNRGGSGGTYSWYLDASAVLQSAPAYNGTYP